MCRCASLEGSPFRSATIKSILQGYKQRRFIALRREAAVTVLQQELG